jgi:indole-3-glycerol phosphate synthase
MSSFLERIVADRRADAERRRAEGALEQAKAVAPSASAPRDLIAALTAPALQLIAEVKRASPSAGDIRADADPVATARLYEAGGAAAISVLTEPNHFRGSLEDLTAVRQAVGVPVLRKDFLCDTLHLWEARAAGADAVLLIVAALTQTELVALIDLADVLGMASLVEVHAAEEVKRALDAGARIVGINARDLATLEVDPAIVGKIRPLIPSAVLTVAESGLATRADVEVVEDAGVDAILVGEALMRAGDPAKAIAELLGS